MLSLVTTYLYSIYLLDTISISSIVLYLPSCSTLLIRLFILRFDVNTPTDVDSVFGMKAPAVGQTKIAA